MALLGSRKRRKRVDDSSKKPTKLLKKLPSSPIRSTPLPTRPLTPLSIPKTKNITLNPKLKKKLSIIERLPTEILHQIFIFCNEINALPFVNKDIHSVFSYPSHSLKLEMLKNYIYDLNNEITHHSVKNEFKNRYALDKTILNYNLITPDLLRSAEIDVVLSLPAIKAESKNRLILYHDKLNKKLLETMYSSNHSAEEINLELSRMAEERFNMTTLDDQELSDLPNEEYQDYSDVFYKAPFTSEKLEIIEILHTKEVRFLNCDLVLCNAIKFGHKQDYLSRLLDCAEQKKITTIDPIIESFKKNDLNLVEWCLDNLNDESLLHHDDLWIYLSREKNMEFLRFMDSKGSVPSHEVIGYLNTLHK